MVVAAELSDRLDLRLVLAHVAVGAGVPAEHDSGESAAERRIREGAARLVGRLAAEHGVSGRAEHRSAVGDPAVLMSQIAAEEAADLIVIGAPMRGLRRCSERRLAEQLEVATAVPVLIAPSRGRQGSLATGSG